MTEQAVDQAQPTISPEEMEKLRQEWVRTQFQKANRFLAEKGVIPSKILADESRYLAPYLAIWKMESKRPTTKTYWVMSGDLPSDFVDVKVAKTARDAVRHFSMMWQMQAENLIRSGATRRDATQAKFAQLLVSRAESLYRMHNDEKLWNT
ncbi:DUF4826 family protein [Shewanella oneidensis MR-1]|uniref:DUF4826 domain-containing protein n=1 Tax=Shewanella oneidensis (strain ATCC 700550 / JCM 31522 / CIP 106686 / LMG 19005 / NCIMB 14063 / MR-1) TaxID=211586 RepID=Q8EDV6_SHEON|nr:DUF4826 family protein [Shewanella oneidensis]AAN55665.1 uncharacterized protein SO_2637 [Shewanella oneidensis MR-1]MDX5995692.1 DUF4826 family protein [Shewanella oneidensis]MEE2026257.1 hypothetical protein [Shewanella oneidensis]QKG97141.1 DUF4826 family protein [Shewanella oneidensis MR-1]